MPGTAAHFLSLLPSILPSLLPSLLPSILLLLLLLTRIPKLKRSIVWR